MSDQFPRAQSADVALLLRVLTGSGESGAAPRESLAGLRIGVVRNYLGAGRLPVVESALAQTLATQFGRGDRSVQTSLSKALVHLAPHSLPVIEQGETSSDEAVRLHATATRRLLHAPEEGYDVALDYAQRVLALKGAPTPPDEPEAQDSTS